MKRLKVGMQLENFGSEDLTQNNDLLFLCKCSDTTLFKLLTFNSEILSKIDTSMVKIAR